MLRNSVTKSFINFKGIGHYRKEIDAKRLVSNTSLLGTAHARNQASVSNKQQYLSGNFDFDGKRWISSHKYGEIKSKKGQASLSTLTTQKSISENFDFKGKRWISSSRNSGIKRKESQASVLTLQRSLGGKFDFENTRRMSSGSEGVREAEGKLLKKVLEIVQREKLVTGIDLSKKVIDFKHPEELKSLLALNIGQEGADMKESFNTLEKVVQYSVKTQHPHYYNQLYGGIDEVALTGTWITEAFNTNQHTFEVSPVFTLVEHFMVKWLVELFGWKEGDGIFSPGGSMSNMYGMVLARYKKHPEVKRRGTSSMKPLVAFTSDQAHYSISKAASWMGIGMDHVVPIPTDRWGRMDPGALKEAVKEARGKGQDPFFVNATAGTTVFGAYDPLNQLADVCQEEGLWLHVDACWGGTAIISKKHKHLLDGIHRADSIAWNPHKMLGAPLQCSPVIVRHKGLLHETNSAAATYLFQQDKFYDVSYDTGDKSIQCGRKVDAFKLYYLLSVHGLDELEKRVDAAFSASRYLCEEVGKRPGFRQVLEAPQCTNTCFWYIPPSMRDCKEDEEWWQRLGKVAPKIKERMVKAGTMMIGYQPVPQKGLVNFIRLVNSCYPTPTHAQMDQVLDEIERLGRDL